MEVIKRIRILLLPILLVSCSEQTDVSLEEFQIEEDVFVSGKALMSLDYGLRSLEEQSENQEILLIGVHGSESRGYEWVYPLQTLDTPETLTLFFRWNDKKCPGPSYEKLYSSIDSLLQLNYRHWPMPQSFYQNGEVSFDFAFIDADKANYLDYYKKCLRLVRKGGVIAIDNVLWSGAVINSEINDNDTNAIKELNDFLAQDDRVSLSMVPIGDGLTLAFLL